LGNYTKGFNDKLCTQNIIFSVSEKNKRIAKNTGMLYLRMLLVMGVTLYTSRIVLQTLGITDYGIYNVVGGAVSMLGFVNASLSGATSRFITFELGRGAEGNVRQVFRCVASIHYIIAGATFLVAESIGLWLVIYKLSIPPERIFAAFWVYQCSLLTFIISIVSTPYNALIIAHERMGAFAYIATYEVLAKLLIVFLLTSLNADKLITYAILLLLVQLSVRIIYAAYCRRHFPEVDGRWMWKRAISLKIFKFAGWTLNGDLAVIGYTQGINILLNLYFGPVVNAARGVAVQVQAAIIQLFSNFLMAVRPQIVKSYAQGDLDYMHSLVLSSSRYAFYLFVVVAFPLLVNTEYVLHIWLGNVPQHTVAFTRLMIITCMSYTLSSTTVMAIHATGDLKRFQIVEGTLLLTVVPVAWGLLKFAHISAETVFVVYLLIEIFTQFVRVWIVYPRICLPRRKYFMEVLYPLSKVCFLLIPAGVWLYQYAADNFIGLIGSSLICLVFSLIVLFILGLTRNEQIMLSSKVKAFVKKQMQYKS